MGSETSAGHLKKLGYPIEVPEEAEESPQKMQEKMQVLCGVRFNGLYLC